jgi:hypothetical protein
MVKTAHVSPVIPTTTITLKKVDKLSKYIDFFVIPIKRNIT